MIINRNPDPARADREMAAGRARAEQVDYSQYEGPDTMLAYLDAANGGDPNTFKRRLTFERQRDSIVGWCVVLVPTALVLLLIWKAIS